MCSLEGFPCIYGYKSDRFQQKCTGKDIYMYSTREHWWGFGKKSIDHPFIVECDLGFYGNHCKKPCVYPFYGAKCVLRCNCSEEECHFIHGCRDPHIEGILLEIMLDHVW